MVPIRVHSRFPLRLCVRFCFRLSFALFVPFRGYQCLPPITNHLSRITFHLSPSPLRGFDGYLLLFDLGPRAQQRISMKQVHLDLPELGFIVATRAILGAGVALLLSHLITRDQRRTIGATLTVIGLVTTVPSVWAVCGNLEKARTNRSGDNQGLAPDSRPA